MLNKEFQRNQNNNKVGRVFTQKDGIIFKPSVKLNLNISKPMLQGIEIPSDAFLLAGCKATWVSSLSPIVTVSVILQI